MNTPRLLTTFGALCAIAVGAAAQQRLDALIQQISQRSDANVTHIERRDNNHRLESITQTINIPESMRETVAEAFEHESTNTYYYMRSNSTYVARFRKDDGVWFYTLSGNVLVKRWRQSEETD